MIKIISDLPINCCMFHLVWQKQTRTEGLRDTKTLIPEESPNGQFISCYCFTCLQAFHEILSKYVEILVIDLRSKLYFRVKYTHTYQLFSVILLNHHTGSRVDWSPIISLASTTNPRDPCLGLIWSYDQAAGAGGSWSHDVVSWSWGAAASELNHSPHHSLHCKVKLEESLLYSLCFSAFSDGCSSLTLRQRRKKRRRRGRIEGGDGRQGWGGWEAIRDASPLLSLNKEAQMFVECKSICCKHIGPEVVREECVSLEWCHIVGDMQKSDGEKGWIYECGTTSSSFNIKAICCSSGREPNMDGWFMFSVALLFSSPFHSSLRKMGLRPGIKTAIGWQYITPEVIAIKNIILITRPLYANDILKI